MPFEVFVRSFLFIRHSCAFTTQPRLVLTYGGDTVSQHMNAGTDCIDTLTCPAISCRRSLKAGLYDIANNPTRKRPFWFVDERSTRAEMGERMFTSANQDYKKVPVSCRTAHEVSTAASAWQLL